MVNRAIAVLLLVAGGTLFAGTAWAGEIAGHVFQDNPSEGRPGVYDPDPDPSDPSMPIDAALGGPEYGILLTQIGERDDLPQTGVLQGPWFEIPGPDGAYAFSGLPDNGVFQIELPSLDPTVLYGRNIITTDATGMKTPMPVNDPPLGITITPPTPTEVDLPILGAVAPAFSFASPPENQVVGGLFVDANTSGQTGGGGIGRRGSGSTNGPQYLYGDVGDGIQVVLQCLDSTGQPTGAPLTTIVGSPYTFTAENLGPPEGTFTLPGIFMFLGKDLLDGEAVQISLDPTQPALASYLPVAPTTLVRTYDMGAMSPDEPLPVIEFRFQPVSDLVGNVKVEDTQGITRPMPGVTLNAIDLFTGMTVDTVTTDSNGDYLFADLFNAIYRIEVVPSGGLPAPFAIRPVDRINANDPDPADVDFCFTQASCPDGVAPTLTVPGNIVQECAAAGGNVVTWPAPTATDDFTPDDQILISASHASGDTFGVGTTTVTVTATDWCGNTATGSFTITVEDTTPPDITCSLPRTILWPPRHALLPVGLSASATDVCDGPVGLVVTVFTDEPDGGPPFSPDATGLTIPALQLRAERVGNGDGRVYLIRITATDQAGNTATVCKCSVVPRAPVGRFILDAIGQAAAAEADCLALDPSTGIPAGFQEILRIGAPQP